MEHIHLNFGSFKAGTMAYAGQCWFVLIRFSSWRQFEAYHIVL